MKPPWFSLLWQQMKPRAPLAPSSTNAQIAVVGSAGLNPERARADQPLVLKYYKHDPTSLGSRVDPTKPAFSV
jgi:hypothetical protein